MTSVVGVLEVFDVSRFSNSFLVCFSATFVAVAIWRISKSQSPRSTLWWACGIIAVGIVCFIGTFRHETTSADLLKSQDEIMHNVFLIIAAIGTNLLATSAILNEKNKGTNILNAGFCKYSFSVLKFRIFITKE